MAFTDGHIDFRQSLLVRSDTDNGRIGFADWLTDPDVFNARAAQWDGGG